MSTKVNRVIDVRSVQMPKRMKPILDQMDRYVEYMTTLKKPIPRITVSRIAYVDLETFARKGIHQVQGEEIGDVILKFRGHDVVRASE